MTTRRVGYKLSAMTETAQPRQLPEGVDRENAQDLTSLLYQQGGPLAVALFDVFTDHSKANQPYLFRHSMSGQINTAETMSKPNSSLRVSEVSGIVIYRYSHDDDNSFRVKISDGKLTMRIQLEADMISLVATDQGLHEVDHNSGEAGDEIDIIHTKVYDYLDEVSRLLGQNQPGYLPSVTGSEPEGDR